VYLHSVPLACSLSLPNVGPIPWKGQGPGVHSPKGPFGWCRVALLRAGYLMPLTGGAAGSLPVIKYYVDQSGKAFGAGSEKISMIIYGLAEVKYKKIREELSRP
jgi:hypothetical protein